MAKQDLGKDHPYYLIQTSLGNCIARSGAKAQVNISEGLFLAKGIEDLLEGDQVAYFREGIETTLKEIEPFLTQSQRYDEARKKLYVDDEDGNSITKFRYDLINAVADMSGIRKDVVDANIFKPNGADFTPKEYSNMITSVQEVLDLSRVVDHTYDRSTIEAWLTGETLAPHDWKVFDAMGVFAPEFKKYNLTKDEGGMHDHYKLFVIVRQGIMRYLLSKGSRRSKDDTESQIKKAGSINLSQEIDIVVSQFVGHINEEYKLARVLQIKKLDVRSANILEERMKEAHPEHRLVRKVVLNSLPEPFGNPISYAEVVKHFQAVNAVLIYAMVEYLNKTPNEPIYNYLKSSDADKVLDPFYATQGIFSGARLLQDPRSKNRIRELEHSVPHYIAFLSHMTDGTIDSTLGLDMGQFYKAWSTAMNLQFNIPQDVLEYRLEVSRQMRQNGKINKEMMKKKAAVIQDKYGYTVYPGEHVEDKLVLDAMLPYMPNFPDLHKNMTKYIDDRDFMIFFAEKISSRGQTFITPEKTQKLLDTYGIGYMARLIHLNEFAWCNKTLFDHPEKYVD